MCSSEEDGWKEVTEADMMATEEVKAPEADSGTPRQQPVHGGGVLSPVLEDDAAKIRRSWYAADHYANFTALVPAALCLCTFHAWCKVSCEALKPVSQDLYRHCSGNELHFRQTAAILRRSGSTSEAHTAARGREETVESLPGTRRITGSQVSMLVSSSFHSPCPYFLLISWNEDGVIALSGWTLEFDSCCAFGWQAFLGGSLAEREEQRHASVASTTMNPPCSQAGQTTSSSTNSGPATTQVSAMSALNHPNSQPGFPQATPVPVPDTTPQGWQEGLRQSQQAPPEPVSKPPSLFDQLGPHPMHSLAQLPSQIYPAAAADRAPASVRASITARHASTTNPFASAGSATASSEESPGAGATSAHWPPSPQGLPEEADAAAGGGRAGRGGGKAAGDAEVRRSLLPPVLPKYRTSPLRTPKPGSLHASLAPARRPAAQPDWRHSADTIAIPNKMAFAAAHPIAEEGAEKSTSKRSAAASTLSAAPTDGRLTGDFTLEHLHELSRSNGANAFAAASPGAGFRTTSSIDPAATEAQWGVAAEGSHEHEAAAHRQEPCSTEEDGSGYYAGAASGKRMTAGDRQVSQSVSAMRSWRRKEADARTVRRSAPTAAPRYDHKCSPYFSGTQL